MAPTVMTTTFRKRTNKKFNRSYAIDFMVTCENFDGDELLLEVTATDRAEAARIATNMAANRGMHDIYNMFISQY